MKIITQVDESKCIVVNKLMEKDYSIEKINSLIKYNVIKLYETQTSEDVAEIYYKKLCPYYIKSALMANGNLHIFDFICKLGKERYPNILTSENTSLTIEIMNTNIVEENLTILFAMSSQHDNEVSKYYAKDNINNILIGQDCSLKDKDFKIFLKEPDLTFEESLKKISTLLGNYRITFLFNSQNNYYTVFLDGEFLGVWSEELSSVEKVDKSIFCIAALCKRIRLPIYYIHDNQRGD